MGRGRSGHRSALAVLIAQAAHVFAAALFLSAVAAPHAVAGGFWKSGGKWLNDPYTAAEYLCATVSHLFGTPPHYPNLDSSDGNGFFFNGQGYSFFCGSVPIVHAVLLEYQPSFKNAGCCGPGSSTPNPINIGTGNKYLTENDYKGSGPFPLEFTRTLNTGAETVWNWGTNSAQGVSLGVNWRHNYDRAVSIERPATTQGTTAAVSRPDGKAYLFRLSGGQWRADSDVAARLERLFDSAGNPAGWRLTSEDDLVETYDMPGRLISITNRAGLSQALTYDAQGRLQSVADPFGRTLTFSYASPIHIATVTDPDGGIFEYSYTPSFRGNLYSSALTAVTYPDGKTRQYRYEDSRFPVNPTGIVDENGDRFATYGYDGVGRAILSEHAGGADRVTVAHNSPNGNSVVTDAFGVVRAYTFIGPTGRTVNTSIQGGACPQCGPLAQTYAGSGYRASETDWNGNRTNYVHDARGLQISRTEGLTSSGGVTAQTRRIETTWHATLRLPTQITEKNAAGSPVRRTDNTYDTTGNLLTRTITDAQAGTSRAWSYTYDANGQVVTLDGPRTDVADVTTYTYYANDALCSGANPIGCRGQMETITNAAGHVTRITEYNAHGQPLSITGPNGLVTALTYDARRRITSRNVGGETTLYAYDNVGQLTRVTLPDLSFLDYTYDAAHRLTQIADNLGNRIAYTLDAMGNRTREDILDTASQLAQTRSRVYSNLNRLSQEIGAQGQTTTYGYDNQGNLTGIDGPLGGTVDVTTNNYDALNRLVRVTAPDTGQVNYGYDTLDQLIRVTDPRNLATTYRLDALGNLNEQVSPDTGTTTRTYDAAGNLLTQTDAKGQLTGYAYDALNRVTRITYAGGVVHDYEYDQGANGIGRLTGITEPASTTQYAYDPQGRLTRETRTINGVAYATGYDYDAAGRLTGITYPTGREVRYTLDALGRIEAIATTKGTTAQTLLSGAVYRPFGPVGGFTFGNGQAYARGFDQDGRVTSYTLGNRTIALTYDAASRIERLSDVANPANGNTYSYDHVDRLIQAITPGTPYGYAYDPVGNRVSKTVGVTTESYGYAQTSNRLTQILGAASRSFSYDANGSTLADGVNHYGYDTRGRMTQALTASGTTNYALNALGQRIRKTSPQADTVYHYDAQGRLIAETSATGQPLKEYIYLGDTPVAVVR